MGLARQIALPHEHAPERFPSFPALERTAVMSFNNPATLNLPASTPVKVLLTRQAAYPAWAEYAVSGAAWYVTYRGDAEVLASGATPYSQPRMSMINTWTANNAIGSAFYPGLTGVTTNITPYAIVGLDYGTGPLGWTFVPANWTCLAVVAQDIALSNSTGVTLNYDVWFQPGETNARQVSGTISATNFGVGIALTPAPGAGVWIRPTSVTFSSVAAGTNFNTYVTIVVGSGTLTYTSSTLNQGTVALGATSATGLVPLNYPNEFSNSYLPWSSTRLTAAAFLGTNVSQVLNKGGTVLAGRIAPQVANPWTVPSTYINSLHPAEKAFLPLETGIYTYAPPSSDLAEFSDFTMPNTAGAVTSCPVYRLDNTSLVNVMFITAGSVAETLACNIDWHIEFRTSSALFPIGLSAVTLETLHQAQLALASVGFFFENPKHSKILGAVIGAAKRYGPAILGLAHPGAGRVANAVIKLSNRPRTSIKPSSAEASGMVKKQHEKKAPPKPKGKGGKKGKNKK